MKIKIEDIIVGDRHRRDMGDLKALASSIEAIGLLQPIGVTEDRTLIFGERRLRACRDVLGWAEIEAREVDMVHIVVGENAENEVRKDFTPSERVAIAKAISEELGERRGGDTSEGTQRNPQNFAECKGQETREFAAKRAGFGNRETLRQAETVVDKAEPELVQAMDEGKVSVFSAYKASKREPEEQREIAKSGKSVQDFERERIEQRRQNFAKQHPLVTIEAIANATVDLAHHQMSPEDFLRFAKGETLNRFRRAAIPALAFLKTLTEVEHDQKRTG